MKKVLITDTTHPILIAGLEKNGYQCDYLPEITHDETLKIIGDYEGLIINSKIFVNKTMIDAASQLRFVGRLGSGMEIVDIPYAEARGIAILSSPEGNRNAVAEHALGMLLALANNLHRSQLEVKNFQWHREKNRGLELMGKTVGIIGFGNTGSAFASKLIGLGVRILTYDKYLFNFHKKTDIAIKEGKSNTTIKTSYKFSMKGTEWTDENWRFATVEAVPLLTIMQEADIISFHLPLNAETEYMANNVFFNTCQKPIVLINTSRGKVVKTEDLIVALEKGKVRGACLDVFENEKTGSYTEGERYMYEKLFSFDNVIVSPHIAGWTQESKARLASVLLKKIETIINVDSV
jgi:D-3-phosphoglycerate dehydrogenase / 2-oxoglutarate reductase